MAQMKALVKEGSQVEVKLLPIPQLSDDEDVLIRIKRAGLCRTDIYAAEGKISTINPLILGHEFCGFVQEIGKNVHHLKPGNLVTVNPLIDCETGNSYQAGQQAIGKNKMFLGLHRHGAFAEYIVVPSSAVYQLPDNVDLKTAAYSEPIAASLAVLEAGIRQHERGMIYGDNRISHLTLKLLKAFGFDNVIIYDPIYGEELEKDCYDFIIETVVTTEILQTMIQAIKPKGTIVLKSRHYQQINFTLGEIIAKEPTLQVVNYGSFEKAVSLIADKRLDIDDLLGQEFDVEEFEQVFAAAKQNDSRKLFFRF